MAKRPDGSYVSNVFNPGLQKGIPNGFVDTVLAKDGTLLGYEKDGEFYKVGEKAKPKPQKLKEPDSVKDLNFKIKMLDIYIAQNQDEIFNYKPGTADYKEVSDRIRKFKEEQKGLKTRLEVAKNKDTFKEEQGVFKKDEKTYQEDIKIAKKDVQVAQDTGGDIKSAKKALSDLEAKKPKPPVPTPSTGSVRYQGSTFSPGKQTAPTPTANGTPSTLAKPGTTKDKTGGGAGGEAKLTNAQQREQALTTAAEEDFALPETLFNNIPSLKLLLERYVEKDWTPPRLRKEIRDDVWYRQNSKAIKERYIQLYNFRDLVKTGRAQGTTKYEQDIVSLEREIADKARKIGSGIASDPDALRKAAENMYITNAGIDDAMTTDFIAAAIRPITSTIGGVKTEGYSGEALTDYQAIQKTARSNGFTVKDIIPGGKTELQILQGLATGSIDANRLAQDARKLAAQGQPQYVRDLLGQGYDLDQIFAPYRQTMANLLEINEDQIDLNDPMLRNGITEKGDMNIFDFKKTLKKDSRWQYTENAKTEISDITLEVLRDFGFQG